MIRVVLDANLFVSALVNPRGIPAKILAAWRDDRFDLVVSPAILREMERVLRYPRIAKLHGWPERKIILFLEDLAHLAILTAGTLQLHVVRTDPSDNRYLECAVEGNADFLVSGDADLLNLDTYQEIRILRPAAFWELLEAQSGA